MYVVMRNGKIVGSPASLGIGVEDVRIGGGVLLKVLLDPSNEIGLAVPEEPRIPAGNQQNRNTRNTDVDHKLGF